MTRPCCADSEVNQGRGCHHRRAARRAKSQSIFTGSATFLNSLSTLWHFVAKMFYKFSKGRMK